MQFLGTIHASPEGLDPDAWVDLIAAHDALRPAPPETKTNPFTDEPVEFPADPRHALVVVDSEEVGIIEWSRAGMDTLSVASDEEEVAIIAEEIAERLGATFRVFEPGPADVDALVAMTVESLQLGCVEEATGRARAVLANDEAPSDAFAEEAAAAALPHVADDDPRIAAQFALFVGACMEHGAEVQGFAAALIDPLSEAVTAAQQLVAPLARVLDGLDPEEVEERLKVAAAERPAAHAAFRSLAAWAPPAVLALCREPEVLSELRARGELVEGVRDLSHFDHGAHCLRALLATPIGAPLIVLFPELDEAFELEVSGCVDLGQLCVLLSHTLEEPLSRIEASGPAPDEVHEVMRGSGPQSVDAAYSCSFQAYSWQAIAPEDGLPKDDRFVWEAPGGRGLHSLPPDFLVGELEPLEGDVRVIAVVGPAAPDGMRFTRVLGAARMFDGLAASLTPTPSANPERWLALARERAADVEPPPPELLARSATASFASAKDVHRPTPRRPFYVVLVVMVVVVIIIYAMLFTQSP